MSIETQSKIVEFRKDLEQLYDNIQQWVMEQGLVITKGIIEIGEQELGSYQVPQLTIQTKGEKKLAILKPIGTMVIGAKSRVDLIGDYDHNTFLYLEDAGPIVGTTIKLKNGFEEASSKRLFKGVNQQGWYWIENPRIGRVRVVNRELFFDLLDEVSDYAIE